MLPVLPRAALVALAGSPAAAATLVRNGVYRQLLRGTYVDAAEVDSLALRIEAARVALPQGTVLGGRAALWLSGVPYMDRASLEVTVPRGRHLERRPGLTWWSADLPDHEIVQVGDVAALSAARVVVDVARREPLVEAVVVADTVLRSGAATMGGILRSLDQARGLRGIERARIAMAHVEPRSESPMESRTRLRLAVPGLPAFEAQWDAYDESGRHLGRLDLRARGTVLEYDGRRERLELARFGTDRQRQGGLLGVGLELRRFSQTDVTGASQGLLVGTVRKALVISDARPAPRVVPGPDTLPAPRLTPLPTRAEIAARRVTAAA